MSRILLPSKVSTLSRLNRMLEGEKYSKSRIFIVLDENSYNHCLPTVISRMPRLEGAEFFEVPVGEEAKSIEVASQLWTALLESGADRNSVIVNLGGGVVSDIGGFVAAGFKRGIRYINIPTTLIAMVDAAIGGKTAVNMGVVKNQVGFFHQPEVVCICPEFLDSLPDVEMVSGLFEIVKTLLLSDSKAFSSLTASVVDKEGLPMDAIIGSIAQCVEFKQAVVSADEREGSVRKILNFGHTFGHAIESFFISKGEPLSHGIAVGIGLKCELYLSCKKLGMSDVAYEEYCRLLHHLVDVPRFSLRDTETLLTYMRSDKKNADGLILCVLLLEPGVPVVDVAIDENEVRDALLS